jgi:dienelactone hydrolase
MLSLMICSLALFKPLEAHSQYEATKADQALQQMAPVDQSKSGIERSGSAREMTLAVNHGPSEYIKAWWWPAAVKKGDQSEEKRPAIILLHGCGGMLDRHGRPDQRMQFYAAWLLKQHWHVLALDSFSSRGVREICRRPRGEQAIVNQSLRRADLAAAIAWLIAHDAVDQDRLALIGWSNGGSTVLEYTHHKEPQGLKALYPGLRAAAAFYPGCAYRQRNGYQATIPVLLLLGLSDDWTSPEPCFKLASSLVEVTGWENAFHGFDGHAPLRFRTDIRTGTNPRGVHQGANREAGDEAKMLLMHFLAQHLANDARENSTSPGARARSMGAAPDATAMSSDTL